LIRLFLVDDEPVILEDLASFLGQLPDVGEMYTAACGADAIKLIEQYAIDIMVTDIRMPGMSGLELCEYAKESGKTIQCILLSGYAEFEYAQQALKNQAAAYLLKPVKKDELTETIRRVACVVYEKWKEIGSIRKAQQTLRSHLSLLQARMLQDVLRGKKYSQHQLAEELDKLDIPFPLGGQAAMMMMRIENRFLDYDEQSTSLFEFAIVNIAEEVLNECFEVWACKDDYHHLIFLLKRKGELLSQKSERKHLERLAIQLQFHVSSYLGGKVSVLVSDQELFPDQLIEMYQKSLMLFQRLPGSEQGFLLRLWDQPLQTPLRSLKRLYEPPTVLHLMEARRWQEAFQRLDYIFDELSEQGLDTSEHLTEVFFALSNAFSCIIHMSGRQLADVLEEHLGMATSTSMLRSAKQLHGWSIRVLRQMEDRIAHESKDSHGSFVQQIHRFIEGHLSEDVSLQAIGRSIHLHPAYISAMYKQETGENLSDYIYRYRMERASFLLRNSKARIYEIAAQLGYQYTPYFTKLFKAYFGVPPQDYRESSNRED
jgi:two-component system response regulator YesN